MAGRSHENIPLSSINPQYLHANSTSHTWPFGAFAELIDNAYDPDVNAKQQWIDWTRVGDMDCLIFMDNGAGLDYDKMLKMMSFGYSDKKSIRGRAPVGQYGNGFKSGSMRLGKDVIVFSKTRDTMSVGLLSQTYLNAIQALNVVVPIVTCRINEEHRFSDMPEHEDSMKAILQHSLFHTEAELLRELQAINTMSTNVSTGTRIIIWNLRRSKGKMEFDFEKDRYDIRIPRVDLSDVSNPQDLRKNLEPKSMMYSLREYCSILYLKPRMQIIIRGQKVQSQLVSKSLALTRHDKYTPQFLKRPISLTFGYNTTNKESYGLMMYYKNRLIKAYEHVGCQRRATPKGVGVVCVVECNFLTPTHNKQDFDATEEYSKVKHRLGEKLEEYWNEIRYLKRNKDPNCTLPMEDMEKSPDQNWVQCNDCQKWRRLPDGIDASKLPDEWFCYLNTDPQYRTCQAEEELEDSADEQPYQKTYKEEMKQQQEKNRQQNAEDALSTSTTPSSPGRTSQCYGGTTGSDVTHFTQTASTPLSRSGRRLCVQGTPFSSRMQSATKAPPRSKRMLLGTPESEQRKRAKVSGQSTSSAADTEMAYKGFSELCQEVSQSIPDVLLLSNKSEASCCPSDGALEDKSIESNTLARATSHPSAVPQLVSTSSQTETWSMVKVKPEEKRVMSLGEDESFELTQLLKKEHRELTDSCGGVHPLQEMQQDWLLEQWETASKERDQYKELMETANRERDQYKVQVDELKQELQQMGTSNVQQEQCDQAPGGEDDLALQLDSTFRDLVKSNNEREQMKSELASVAAEREALISQCELLKKELKDLKRELEDLREAGKKALSPSPAQRTGNSPSTSGSTETERLKNLRLSVSRLLVILIPDLDLEQVSYDSDIIDEILEQYLDGVRFSEAT